MTVKRFLGKYGYYYLMLLPAIIGFVVFKYFPMYGVLIAFKKYMFYEGIWNSPWVGFQHFQELFSGYFFWRVLKNTLTISILKLVFAFPAPILLALLFNEVYNRYFKRFVQSVSYLPHFLSWVILAGIFTELLSPTRGIVNYILQLMGFEPVYFLASVNHFVGILIVTHVWQTIGWGSIIYLAAIAGINQEMFEAAKIDGANRFRQIVHITLPSLIPVITIVFILNLGNILEAGFDQVFNLYNPAVYEVADIIDTYVYRIGIQQANYSFATAVGLFQNVVGLVLVLSANYVIRRYNEHGIW